MQRNVTVRRPDVVLYSESILKMESHQCKQWRDYYVLCET